MRIIFDVSEDAIAGLEWRMLLLSTAVPPRILSKSWRHFKKRSEVLEELTLMAKVFGFDLEVVDGKYKFPSAAEKIHPISSPKEIEDRKDLNG